MINYGYLKSVKGSISGVEEILEIKLKEVGFSIVTRVDMQEKFKNKLNLDYKKYLILGVCSPANALKAIETEENIGLMLPCSVIIYEEGDNITVGVIKPTVAMSMIKNPKLIDTAKHIEMELISAIDRI